MDRITLVHRDSLSCEAIVRRLSDGSLLLLSQCGGMKEPDPANRVYAFRSDDGEKWSAPVPVGDNGRALYATDLDVCGDKITTYVTEHGGGFLDFDCYALVSEDRGESWKKEPLPCFSDTFVFLRGTVRHGGKTLVAYQHYPIGKEENDALAAEGKTILDSSLPFVLCGALVSEDGVHFTKGEDIAIPNEFAGKRVWQWPEPTIAFLPGSGYAIILRVNGAGVLYRSDSPDGLHWSRAYPTDIPNPNNKPKLINLQGGAIALINTPGRGVGFKYRNPLEIWISDDGMKSWRYKKRVLDFPGWLSYPDGFAEGDRILFSFEVNRHDVYFADCDISDYFSK